MATVAVVNDDEDACEIVARIIERDGHKVHRLSSAEAAADSIAQGGVDLAILDLHSGGPAANRTLLGSMRSAGSDVRAVLVGRSAGAGLLAWQAGADGYLVRPFHADELCRSIDEALARADGERESHRRSAIAAIASS